MNLRQYKIRGFLYFLLFFVTNLLYGANAWADLPEICIAKPTGSPFHQSGDIITIQWSCPELDITDPEHNQIFYMQIDYVWEGSSEPHYITFVMPENISEGSYSWSVPEVNNPHKLKIVFSFIPNDSGQALLTEESDLIEILPSASPPERIWLSYPNPKAPPDQSIPPVCFDHMSIEGSQGTITKQTFIQWKIAGCDHVDPTENYLDIYYSKTGLESGYVLVGTLDNPCNVDFFNRYIWTIPGDNTLNARIKLVWKENTPTHITPYRIVAESTSTYPFEITTEEINHPPVADAGPDQTVTGRSRVRLNGSGSYDPDAGDSLTYEWTKVAGPHMDTITLDSDFPDISDRYFNAPSLTYKSDLTFKLTVSDGIHAPAIDQVRITVHPDPEDLDGDWVSAISDNCPDVANPSQRDQDYDGVGDACDNCPDVANAFQTNADHDWLGDECDPCPYDRDNDEDGDGLCANVDNCPEWGNPLQDDWDNDGEGDACDCDDGFAGPREFSADCGSACGTTCPDISDSCRALIYNGPSSSKIDVVIIPGSDYWSGANYPQYLNPVGFARQDALDDILNSYFLDSVIGTFENKMKFNVWITTNHAGDIRTLFDGRCDWDAGNWRNHCPQADIAYIIHLMTCRDYSSGGVFSADTGSTGTLLHETGHGLFDLGDEYDDDPGCTTSYGTAEFWSKSNIWRTMGYCEDYTSLPPSECHDFTDCQGRWYKAQSGPSMMECSCPGYPNAICDWGPDALRMVHHVLGNYNSTFSMAEAKSNTKTSEQKKVMVADFVYDGTILKMTGFNIMYGTAGEHLINKKGLEFTLKDSAGGALERFSIQDPLYREFPEKPFGGQWLEEASFSVSIPFHEGRIELEVRQIETGNLLDSFELFDPFTRFCAEFPDDPACQCQGDFKADRDVDGADLTLFAKTYDSGSYLADLNQDQQIDKIDVEIFAGKFGRDNCPDPSPPNCDDGDLCTQDFFDPVTQTCIHRMKQCFDGSACTTDTCDPKTGQCVFQEKICSDNDPYTEDFCDSLTGACFSRTIECDDGDACTVDFYNIKTGQCDTSPVVCNDKNSCTWDACDPTAGCFFVAKTCEDGNFCTYDQCDPKTGQCSHTGINCIDDNPCTYDTCNPDTGCEYIPKDCNDNDICTLDSCDKVTGECVYTDAGCQACCFQSSIINCENLPPLNCTIAGGTPMGIKTNCHNTVCK